MTRPGVAPAVCESEALSTPLLPALPASASLEVVGDDDVRFVRGPRSYRVRGLARNLSPESLKVTLRVSAERGQV